MARKKIFISNKKELLNIVGEQDKNIKNLERYNNVDIYYYPLPDNEGFEMEILGHKDAVEQTFNYVQQILVGGKGKSDFHMDNIKKTQIIKKYEYLAFDGEIIKPKTENQKIYLQAIEENDIVIAIGPAGTGKTFLAVMQALIKLEKGEVYKVVLTRPVVEAGEKLGFLPGDLYDKINPYLKPLYDAFFVMLGPDKLRRYIDQEIIEIIPLAYMRGRTLNDSFIILDEAQNTVYEQMKMFLTRIGYSSQVVITGDVTQIDLNNRSSSGLLQIKEILKEVEEVKFIYFNEHDIIRHKLVKKIVKAYEKWESNK